MSCTAPRSVATACPNRVWTARHPVNRDRNIRQRQRTVAMRKPARVPNRIRRAVRKNLHAALRHLPALHPRHRKCGDACAALGLHRALKLCQRPHAEPGGGEPRVRPLHIGHRERQKMHPRIVRHCRVELAAERGLRGLEQHLHIAAVEHGRDVSRAGWLPLRIDLHRNRGGKKSGAFERSGCGLCVAHKVTDMVEEDFIRTRQAPRNVLGRGFSCHGCVPPFRQIC
jgi:hypothetical protein